MPPIKEIEDPAVRDAVDMFQHYMEIAIIGILDKDGANAVQRLGNARDHTISMLKNSDGSELTSYEQEAKTNRITMLLLEQTWDRLIDTMRRAEEPDG